MKVYFGADHAGFALKEALLPFVASRGYDVEDYGAHEFDADDDYPDFVAPVARAVSQQHDTVRGIVLGGSGQGEAIVANRFPHVRAVVFNGQYSPQSGRKVPDEIALSREHNDANVLSLGARFLDEREAQDAVLRWLGTPFSGDERHTRRVRKIDEVEGE